MAGGRLRRSSAVLGWNLVAMVKNVVKLLMVLIVMAVCGLNGAQQTTMVYEEDERRL
jgi:hypothetical protein